MTSLSEKFLSAVAFDERDTKDEAAHEDSDGYFGFISGAVWENTRLAPIHKAVVEVIDALEFECGGRCAEQNPCNAKEALTNLTEALKGCEK